MNFQVNFSWIFEPISRKRNEILCSECVLKKPFYFGSIVQQMNSMILIVSLLFRLFNFEEQQSNELPESTMTVETQQNHDRLMPKNGVANAAMDASNTNGVKKSTMSQQQLQQQQQTQQQQKDEQYKRYTENAMQVCNVNVMENHLASR